MKKLLLLLSFVFILNSVVFGASTNSVTKIQHVKDGASLASASYEIVPHSEVETGSSIIITFTNATVFSQDVIDGTCSDTKAPGYKAGGYQFNENGVTWDRTEGFYDVMPRTDSSQLPYYIRRMNDIQIEVFLINVPDVYAGNSLSDLNGSGRDPYYSIPLVVYADSDGDAEVTVEIDSNGTSISGSSPNDINNSLATSTTQTATETTSETTTEAVTEETTAQSLDNKVEVKIGSDTIVVNGTDIKIDAPAYIQTSSSSTMIPLRAVSQGIVGDADCVSWEADTKTAVITYKGNEIRFAAGSDRVYINGMSKIMDNGVKAEINNSRMFVPFRTLGEALGADVSWDPQSKTAYFN